MNIIKTLSLTAAMLAAVGASAEVVTMHTPENFQVLSVSPNGRWACGVFIDAANNTFGFRWNLEGGGIEILGSTPGTAYDVANDGTVSGDFQDTKALANGAPVSMPGFWRDGRWHSLMLPGGKLTDGIGYGISPDGRYMTGAICVDGRYSAYIWEDGVIHRSLDANDHAVSFAVTPDGNGATGFVTTKNRTACFWRPEGKTELFTDSPEYSYSPWNYGRNFSPDGSKLVYWGGWEVSDARDVYLYCIYDVTTGERIKVQAPAYESDLEFFDVSNNGLLVGQESRRGYVYADGKGMYVDDYLKLRGVDISDFEDFYSGADGYVGTLPISNVVAVSEDEKVFAMTYYDKLGQPASLILKIDQDLSQTAPAEVRAERLQGVNVVKLDWKCPAGVKNIRGYNVYRDGKKISGALPLNAFTFNDKNLAVGTYTYEVSAVHTSGEVRAEAVTVTVDEPVSPKPISAYARQKGFNSALFAWYAPMSNILHKHYFDPEFTDYGTFALYEEVDVEMAVKYSKAEMSAYTGYQITEVSFMPLGEQKSWCVNIYKRESNGSLTRLASQPVTQPVEYRKLNVVTLDTPVDVVNAEIIVAIEVSVDNIDQLILGAQPGKTTPGYSDLLRRVTDDDFISTYESSVATGMTVSCMSWAIDMGMRVKDSGDETHVAHYNVYCDDMPVGETTDMSMVIPSLGDGTYAMSVEAVYTDGSVSDRLSTYVDIRGMYPSIRDVAIDAGEEGSTVVTASWEAPVDKDITYMSYTHASRPAIGVRGHESNGYAMMAGVMYPPAKIRGYQGYRIEAFRFYPLTDAIFTFMLYKDDEQVYELEVEDYTVGQWNTVVLPDDIYIDETAKYNLVIDCFDPVPDADLLGVDDECPYPGVSDLYSADNGTTWLSLADETSAPGGWLMDMMLVAPEELPVAIDGYDVVIDGTPRNTERITDTEFAYDFGTRDDKRHSLRVNVYYPARSQSVTGVATYFYMAAAGIADNMIADIMLHPGDNYLVVEGEGVEAVELYSTSGQCVASAKGDRVEISALPAGVYVAKVNVAGHPVVRKISISK